ncbi:MAG: ATP-binding protein [Polyangiaceae bacterium]
MQADPAETEPAILVVDDRPANLLAFQAVLKPLGQPVVTAESGKEALRQLLRREFALLLIDVQMPNMDGFELATRIQSYPRLAGIPIIFVTATSHESSYVFRGYAHGAVDYLLKPFEPELLRAKARVFSELYRAHQTIRAQAQRLHENELREIERRGEERFHRLTESMPLPVWAVRADGAIGACNRAWTEYSGLSLEDTGVMLAAHWVDESDVARAHEAWRSGTQSAAPFDMECRLRCANDASHRWHLLRAVPERAAPASAGSWIVAAVDIDARKMAQEHHVRLLEREHDAREQAEAANRMKDEFIATVSHELRTPLTAILGWTQVLRTGALHEERLSQGLETIERNARAQAALVNDLLDVSQIVSGKLHLEPGLCDVGEVVGEVVDAVRPATDAKRIAVDWPGGASPMALHADRRRLRQIVSNLLSNAVKFTPPGGTIRVRAHDRGPFVHVVVEDTGEGIAQDFLPFVFDRFRQQARADALATEGLGIGLSIAKHLVELHGGQLLAESEGRGQGARFTIVLPTAGQPSPAAGTV